MGKDGLAVNYDNTWSYDKVGNRIGTTAKTATVAAPTTLSTTTTISSSFNVNDWLTSQSSSTNGGTASTQSWSYDDLYIASFQISAPELAQTASEVLDAPFKTVDMGSLESLSAHNRAERAAHPEGETNLYASWQLSQYNYSMFKVASPPLDNSRYPQLTWTNLREVLATLA